MSDTRNPQERLDALLTGLEDEVLRGEAVLTTDVDALRASAERLIARHVDREANDEAVPAIEGIKEKGGIVKEMLDWLAGIGQRAVDGNDTPQVSMTFSDKRKPLENEDRTTTESEKTVADTIIAETSKPGAGERPQDSRSAITREQIEEMVEMAPYLKPLLRAVPLEGEEWETTPEQQAFLDDFEAKLVEGIADMKKASKDKKDRSS